LMQIAGFGGVCDGSTAGGRQRRRRVLGASPTRGCLAKGTVTACAGYGRRAEHPRRRWRASVRGDRQLGHERKLKSRCKLLKTVQNARGDANVARVHDGGGQAEPLVLVLVLSSRDTHIHTARYGSSRRRCSFLAARLHTRGVKMGRLDGHPELNEFDFRGALIFFSRTRIRALRRQYGVKRPEFTETGYHACS